MIEPHYMSDKRQEYNDKYKQPNYFQYQEWLCDPYISSLTSYCKLRPGSMVLDVGCGQGFFSYLFWKHGMTVYGIDSSEVGIKAARTAYSGTDICFSAVDIHTADFPVQFDCIFIRSCSLHNVSDFTANDILTPKLLKYLKVGGTFIFAYYTRLGRKRSAEWRYHSLQEVAQHFKDFPGGKLFFCNRIDTVLLRRYAFSAIITKTNVILSRVCGLGGDAVYVLVKS